MDDITAEFYRAFSGVAAQFGSDLVLPTLDLFLKENLQADAGPGRGGGRQTRPDGTGMQAAGASRRLLVASESTPGPAMIDDTAVRRRHPTAVFSKAKLPGRGVEPAGAKARQGDPKTTVKFPPIGNTATRRPATAAPAPARLPGLGSPLPRQGLSGCRRRGPTERAAAQVTIEDCHVELEWQWHTEQTGEYEPGPPPPPTPPEAWTRLSRKFRNPQPTIAPEPRPRPQSSPRGGALYRRDRVLTPRLAQLDAELEALDAQLAELGVGAGGEYGAAAAKAPPAASVGPGHYDVSRAQVQRRSRNASFSPFRSRPGMSEGQGTPRSLQKAAEDEAKAKLGPGAYDANVDATSRFRRAPSGPSFGKPPGTSPMRQPRPVRQEAGPSKGAAVAVPAIPLLGEEPSLIHLPAALGRAEQGAAAAPSEPLEGTTRSGGMPSTKPPEAPRPVAARSAPAAPPLPPPAPRRLNWTEALDRLKKRIRSGAPFGSLQGRDQVAPPSKGNRSTSPTECSALLDVSYAATEARPGRGGAVAWGRASTVSRAQTQAEEPVSTLLAAPAIPALEPVWPRHPAWQFGTAAGHGDPTPGERRAAAEAQMREERARAAGLPLLPEPKFDLVQRNLGGAPDFDAYAGRFHAVGQSEEDAAPGAHRGASRRGPGPRGWRRPGVDYYDTSEGWDLLQKRVPGPAFGLAEDRFREGDGRRERRERLPLDLDLAVERVRPAAPAWTIAPRRSLSEVRQAARRDREGLGGSLDLEYGLVTKRLPAAPAFEAQPAREHEVDVTRRRRQRQGIKADLLWYNPDPSVVEPSAPVVPFPRAPRYPPDPPAGADDDPPEGQVLVLEGVDRALEALRHRQGAFIDMGRHLGRDGLALRDGRPGPSSHLPLPDPDLDLPLRRNFPVPNFERDDGHAAPEGRPDEFSRRRGPGLYDAGRYGAIGEGAPAADFSHALGRPEPAATREGDVLELNPDDRVQRSTPYGAVILPEGRGESDAPRSQAPDAVYEWSLDAIRPRAHTLVDLNRMLPRTEPRRPEHTYATSLDDVPLSALARWPPGPVTGTAVDFSRALGREDRPPRAADILEGRRLQLNADAALDRLRPGHHTMAPDMRRMHGHSLALENRDPQIADLTSWLDYEPKLSAVRPRLLEPLTFERQGERPEAASAEADYRNYNLDPMPSRIRAIQMHPPREMKIVEVAPGELVGVQAKPSDPKRRAPAILRPEPFSRESMRWTPQNLRSRGYAEAAELTEIDRATKVVKRSSGAVVFGSESAHPTSVWQTAVRVVLKDSTLPLIHSRRPPSRVNTLGVVTENEAEVLTIVPRVAPIEPKPSRIVTYSKSAGRGDPGAVVSAWDGRRNAAVFPVYTPDDSYGPRLWRQLPSTPASGNS